MWDENRVKNANGNHDAHLARKYYEQDVHFGTSSIYPMIIWRLLDRVCKIVSPKFPSQR